MKRIFIFVVDQMGPRIAKCLDVFLLKFSKKVGIFPEMGVSPRKSLHFFTQGS